MGIPPMPRRVGRMRARLPRQHASTNALYYIPDGCHKDWMAVKVLFPCKNPLYPHYHRPVFRDLGRARSLDQLEGIENERFLKLHCSKHTEGTS